MSEHRALDSEPRCVSKGPGENRFRRKTCNSKINQKDPAIWLKSLLASWVAQLLTNESTTMSPEGSNQKKQWDRSRTGCTWHHGYYHTSEYWHYLALMLDWYRYIRQEFCPGGGKHDPKNRLSQYALRAVLADPLDPTFGTQMCQCDSFVFQFIQILCFSNNCPTGKNVFCLGNLPHGSGHRCCFAHSAAFPPEMLITSL